MRQGKVVGSTDPKETNEEGLAEMMVGRSVVLRVAKSEATPGDTILSIKDLNVLDDRSQPALRDFSLEWKATDKESLLKRSPG